MRGTRTESLAGGGFVDPGARAECRELCHDATS